MGKKSSTLQKESRAKNAKSLIASSTLSDANVRAAQSELSKTSSKKKDSATGSKKKKVNGAKKGKAFEREIATALGHIFPDAQRELEYQAGGNRGTDIEDTDIFQFQCKRYAGYAPISKINEIKLESNEHYPVLITQGNRMECMAVLPFEKFVTLLEIAYGHRPRFINPYVKKDKLDITALPKIEWGDSVATLQHPILDDVKYITATEVIERKKVRDDKIHDAIVAPFMPLVDAMVKAVESQPDLPKIQQAIEMQEKEVYSLSSFL